MTDIHSLLHYGTPLYTIGLQLGGSNAMLRVQAQLSNDGRGRVPQQIVAGTWEALSAGISASADVMVRLEGR
jgi:hypothetical protein